MSLTRRIILVAIVGGLGYFAWRWFFPNDERLIRALLAEFAAAASIRADEAPLARVNNTGRLTALFAEDLEIRVDVANHSISIRGKEDLFKTAMAARANYSPVRVELLDAKIIPGADRRSATVLVAARIHGAMAEDAAFQEVRMILLKAGRKWLIHRVETYRSLGM